MKESKIRYAVVGLGYISQAAILPAFDNAQRNSKLAALVSGDAVKLKELSAKYDVPSVFSYEQYDDCLNSGLIDAVYIALPNSMHCDFAVRAARAGIHVLVEKPMAVSTEECRQMSEAAQKNKIKLMTGYRLHFEKTNLKAIDYAQSGKLGDLRFFHSTFSMQVKEGNSRLIQELSGGTLFDLGIYCINAARNLFQDEPTRVFAFGSRKREGRFTEVAEMKSAVLYFPEDRMASFTCSFGAADTSFFEIVGTKGMLRVDPAYEMVEPLNLILKTEDEKRRAHFSKRDQFSPEILYFSNCILKNEEPEPSAQEGMADVRVINALNESIRIGASVPLEKFEKIKRPNLQQEKYRTAVYKEDLIRAQAPSA
jgi:predicted dehydrogenase